MKLYNSMTNSVEDFVPLTPGKVSMYNCGPTVYKRQHVGNFRAFVTADLLRRSLEYVGFDVTQIMNITDVGHLTEDDLVDSQGECKLQKEAALRQMDPWQIARAEEKNFKDDLALMEIPPAHEYPRATEHIPEMIEMIEILLSKGLAYEVDGNVYFDITKWPKYGALSGNRLDELEAGASGRVDERTDKRHPLDFSLWKIDPKHLMQWDSPWGRGFPGWHIECSAMSRKYLGDTLDIHTGGPDNKFPHHECEIAQSEGCTGETYVRYWVHCGWLEIGGRKMSKSKGKLYTVPELLELGYTGRDLRMLMVKQHYRAPLPFDLELLDDAKKLRVKLNNFVANEMSRRPEGPKNDQIQTVISEARLKFEAALRDDLNTSVAFAVIHEFMTAVNRLQPSQLDALQVVEFMRELDSVFGVIDPVTEADALDGEIQQLIDERIQARSERNFQRADKIRDDLLARGIELVDTPQGTEWRTV
ncbi:MAG: cysteine--tRNA ligase [Myxococcales bacterium]|nr:cysteine--tRNA ligase [Myxococcales bacterium]